MTDAKLDLFKTLDDISQKSTNFYDDLPEPVQKQFHPFVAMRWLTGSSNPTKLYLINELVNPYVFSLSAHKGLVCKLLTVCMDGRKSRYSWIKANTRSSNPYPMMVAVIAEYYGYNTRHANDALPCLDNVTILQHAIDLGMQPDQVKLLKKEMKKRGDI